MTDVTSITKGVQYDVPWLYLQVEDENYNNYVLCMNLQVEIKRITIWCSMIEFTSKEKGVHYDMLFLKLQTERKDYKMMYYDWCYKHRERSTIWNTMNDATSAWTVARKVVGCSCWLIGHFKGHQVDSDKPQSSGCMQ